MANSTRSPRAVAVLGGSASPGQAGSSPTRESKPTAVRERVFDAIRSQAPAIAGPRLDRAVADGTITPAQKQEFLARLESDQSAPAPEFTHDQRLLSATVIEEIRSEAPAIARPLLEQAVADGAITRAEADRITTRLSARRPRLGRRRKTARQWRPVAPGPATA